MISGKPSSTVLAAVLSVVFASASGIAHADDCDLSGLSPDKDMGFICAALKNLGVTNCAPSGATTCKKRQVFSGLQIEPLLPKKAKPWSGFGGGGALYSTTSMCLLRDVQNNAIVPDTAATTLPGTGGNVTYSQRIEFGGWTHGPDNSLEAILYDRGQLSAPIVGTIDAFTVPLRVKAVHTGAGGAKVGEYAVVAEHALDVDAEAYDQKVSASMVAFQVVTPYGAVVVTPEFHVNRHIDFSPTPVGWPSQVTTITTMTAMKSNSIDVLHMSGGLFRSQLMPDATKPNTLAAGWVSQAGFGSRNANPTAALWNPGISPFPDRPDLELVTPRLPFERMPDITATAAVKVAYSITGMLPEVIRNNPILTPDLEVYAEPEIGIGGASQFGLWSHEGRVYTGKPIPVNDKVTLTPTDATTFNQEHRFGIVAGSSVSADYALKAGFIFRIDLHVHFTFVNIDKTLIDINPDTTIAKSINSSPPATLHSGLFLATSQHFAATHQPYERLRTVAGTDVTATQADYLKMCLAKPSQPNTPPAPPTYTPGDPSQLANDLEIPCNICVGMQDTSYTGPFGTEPVAVKGFPPTTVGPVSQAGHQKWTCSWGTIGCYDMCKVNAGGTSMSMEYTAPESPKPIVDTVSGKRVYCRPNG